MSILGEFKAFISKGNVMDLAVGVIIGGAFGNIVTSLVKDVITPTIALAMGNHMPDFSSIAIGAARGDEGRESRPWSDGPAPA